MSKFGKLVKQILKGTAISYQEAENILLAFGFSVKVTGSHHVFRKLGTRYNVSLKKRKKLLGYQMKILREVLINHGYKNEEQ